MLLRAIEFGTGWGLATAEIELEKVINHNPGIVIDALLNSSDQHFRSILLRALRGIYDRRIELLSVAWCDSAQEGTGYVAEVAHSSKQSDGMFYLASVDSEYIDDIITRFQSDNRSEMRDRASIALSKLIKIRIKKLSEE